ncbi:MAG: zinc ribbon domain-containing protein, partial [bacterium]
MQVCRHCGWENPEIAAFCTNCGTGLGRDKGNGPRFRALGLTPRAEETPADSIDAAWPTVATPSAQTPAATPAARPLGAPLAARTSGDATPRGPHPDRRPHPRG